MTRYAREGWAQEHHGDVYTRRVPGQALRIVVISREGLDAREAVGALTRLGRDRAEVARLVRLRDLPAATSAGRCDVTSETIGQFVEEAVSAYRFSLKHPYVSGTAYAVSPGRTPLKENSKDRKRG